TLFGRTLARQIRDLPFGNVLELGAGSGALAESLLGSLPLRYSILETSGALRARQKARLGERVAWLDALPERFEGVLLANEVVDAMPVHAVAWRQSGIMERGVSLQQDSLCWAERPANGELLERAEAIAVPIPYETEIGLAGPAWMRTLGERLERGVIFVI